MCQTWQSSIMRLTCFSFLTVSSAFWIWMHLLMLSPLDWDFPQHTGLISSWTQQLKKWKIAGRFPPRQWNTRLSFWHQLEGAVYISEVEQILCKKHWLQGTLFFCTIYLDAELCRGLQFSRKEEPPRLSLHNGVKQSPTNPGHTPFFSIQWSQGSYSRQAISRYPSQETGIASTWDLEAVIKM